ncbi:hypothetical protein ASE95_11155 [Sphingomonas sp. Leaf231]|uniref:hypothetical protein n=1 Tax=Sphingomonas sp. Leaf231 TaxID=1736301 RepID=UPI0006F4A574|nr:hypothetical protein [Sphingomonas sp. Leaf231]KQN93118.1 hypothetical protein ASE95_11155 [Sphingomonas sp. Leaf231]
MIRSILGALVGREMDKRGRQGGAGGALMGAFAARAVTRMGPLGWALGGAYVAKKAYDRHKAGKVGQSTRVPPAV